MSENFCFWVVTLLFNKAILYSEGSVKEILMTTHLQDLSPQVPPQLSSWSGLDASFLQQLLVSDFFDDNLLQQDFLVFSFLDEDILQNDLSVFDPQAKASPGFIINPSTDIKTM